MTSDSMNQFEQEHFERWWETTRYYLFTDMKSLPGAAAVAKDGWSPPRTDSHGGRKRFMARVGAGSYAQSSAGGRRPAAGTGERIPTADHVHRQAPRRPQAPVVVVGTGWRSRSSAASADAHRLLRHPAEPNHRSS